MAISSVWPESIARPSVEAPKAILQELAMELHDLTGGRMHARVRTEAEGNEFLHELMVQCRINDMPYSLRVISIQHGLRLYPCTVTSDLTGGEWEAHDAGILRERLKDILHQQEATDILEALVAQADEPGR